MGWPFGQEHTCLNVCTDEDMAREWPDCLWCSTCFASFTDGPRCECENCVRPFDEAHA